MNEKAIHTRSARFKIQVGLNRSSHHGRSAVSTRQLIRDIDEGFRFFKTNPKRAGSNEQYSR